MNWFITGTSTGVGKTYATCLLLRSLREAGVRAVGYKPVCSGGREDAEALRQAGEPGPSLDEINPVHFKAALSPYAAALIENRPLAWAALVDGYRALAADYPAVLVEGAGGWQVPLCPGKTIADLAADLALPVLIVADNRLGALNHTILTARAIEAAGLRCAGIVLNHTEEERDAASISNAAILSEFVDRPVIEIMHGQDAIYDDLSVFGAG
ncbi:MAG: dethiobiotin synthase [Verrucomicrobiales bacterium]